MVPGFYGSYLGGTPFHFSQLLDLDKGINIPIISRLDSCLADLLSGFFGESKSSDHLKLSISAEKIIGGYLNLGEKEGWSEGYISEVGVAFTCYMVQYYFRKEKFVETQRKILERVLESLADNGDLEEVTNQVKYDHEINGSLDHAVSRIVGNVSSQDDSHLLFFEILINSARNFEDNEACKPFCISIHDNKNELNKRRKDLLKQSMQTFKVAYPIFYASHLKDPKKIQQTTGLNLHSDSERTLKGLMHLQNKKLNAQFVGNCWIKQPMRALLVCLYLEIFSQREGVTPEEAWEEAVAMYKDIQKKAGIPIVEELLDVSGIGGFKRDKAETAIKKRREI